MAKYRLYYVWGTYSDEDGEPFESPPWGVVVVAQPFAEQHDWVLQNGHAYFYWPAIGEWSEVENEVGERDQLASYAHAIQVVRYGRWIDRPTFSQIQKAAQEWVRAERTAKGLSV